MGHFESLLSSKKLFVFALVIIFLSNCKTQKQNEQWDEASLDLKLSKDTIYSQLDKREEIFSAFEDYDSLNKRTSDVSYFNTDTGKLNLRDESSKKYNNCRAYFHSDTLLIDIGISSGFSGYGFKTFYKDRKFYTEPYYFFDAEIPGFEPTYKIVYQKLTLDKEKYNVGDSLYGRIDFKSAEITKDKKEFEHSGKGYFRALVKKV